MFKSELILDS